MESVRPEQQHQIQLLSVQKFRRKLKLPVVDLLYSPYKHSIATFNARPPRTQYLEGEESTSNAMFSLDLYVKVRASILVGQSIKDQVMLESYVGYMLYYKKLSTVYHLLGTKTYKGFS